MRSRALTLAAMALAALLIGAPVCGSGAPAPPAPTHSSQVSIACAPYVDTLPTAIPTEQWTPEWLSQWSEQHNRAYAAWSDEQVDRFIAADGSAAGIPHVATLADEFAISLDDALGRADEVVAGTVTDQWLVNRHGAAPTYLVSHIERTGADAIDVEQQTSALCRDSSITLGYPDADPLLEAGRTYAVLVTTHGGPAQAVPQHSYELAPDGGLTGTAASPGHPSVTTLHQLQARFDAAHHR